MNKSFRNKWLETAGATVRALRCRCLALKRIALCCLVAWHGSGPTGQATELAGIAPHLRQYLEARIAANPGDASSWRMLGRALHHTGDLPAAHDALQRAVASDPLSAAAHCDLALLLMDLRQLPLAAEHFHQVLQLAPDSEYARTAHLHLPQLPVPARENIIPTGFQIRTFDSAEQLEQIELQTAPTDPAADLTSGLPALRFRFDIGALYNTNVTLTPTARDFFAGEAASAQGFFAPEFEYRVWDGELFRAGPSFGGYFSVNERQLQDLNLQSYQPGLFLERSLPGDNAELVTRLHYVFTHDEFAGLTFGRRHALTASAISRWSGGDSSVLYWTGDYTSFADEGIERQFTSRDGWTNTFGATHTWLLDAKHLRTFTAGVELQHAETVGTDFTYAGVSAFAEAEMPLTKSATLLLDGSWGYRHYYRFALDPARDENVWRAGARLRQRIGDRWSITGVLTYNRFDSPNELFQAERFLTGIITSFDY